MPKIIGEVAKKEKSEGKNVSIRILYPAKLSFNYEGNQLTFSNMRKLWEYSTSESFLKKILC